MRTWAELFSERLRDEAPAAAYVTCRAPRHTPVSARRPRLLILTPGLPPAMEASRSSSHGLARRMTGFEIEVVTLDRPEAGALTATCGSPRGGSVGTPARRRARMLALNAGGVCAVRVTVPSGRRPSAPTVIASPAAVGRSAICSGRRTAQYFYANEILGKPRLSAFAAARAESEPLRQRLYRSLIARTGASLGT